MRQRLFLVILVLLLAASAAAAADVNVTARVEPKKTTIGTPIRYVVDIDAPKDLELIVPLLGEKFGDFFVTDFGDEPAKEENGRVHVVRWFTLVSYESGDKTVPAYPLKYRKPGEEEMQSAESGESTVIVESLMPKAPTPIDIRDIAAPETLPTDWGLILTAAACVVALIVVGGLVLWLASRQRAAALAALPKPHEVALAALARLHARQLLEGGRFEEFYVELSTIVRTYVEGRFGLHAPEMTTEEFFAAMQRDHRLTREHRELLGEFLSESDLVKFARYRPRAEDGERAYGAARRFVEESRDESPTAGGHDAAA